MKVDEKLAAAFGPEFETLLGSFLHELKLIETPDQISNDRFLRRSILPHVQKLSSLFNRAEDQQAGLDSYWKESSNPANLRLAYFLYFMPANLFRLASIWNELARLGYRWPEKLPLRAVEFGAGPASGACGIAAAESFAPIGLPKDGSFALLEQDSAMLKLGESWAQRYFSSRSFDWSVRPFHRKLSLTEGLLPRAAPKFSLWFESFFLNEFHESPNAIATALIKNWDKHVEEDGLIILVEPALKLQSRRLLEVRASILKQTADYQVLLPCLGHQGCGALAKGDDWCHEDVTWWRPKYFKLIDEMAKLDRRNLPFSYLVLSKSKHPLRNLLPELGGCTTERLVSPAHEEGSNWEFFICGTHGKRRARMQGEAGRGDILLNAEVRGDDNSAKVHKILKKL